MTPMTLIAIVSALVAGLLVGWLLGDARRKQGSAEELHSVRMDLNSATVRLSSLETDNDKLTVELQALRAQNGELGQENARLNTRLSEQARVNEEKIKLLEEAREQLGIQFKQLADSIFEHKQQSFNQSSRQTLETMLNPFREQLKEFRSRVDTIHDQETRDRSSLKEQLSQLHQMNQRMSDEALNLTRALKGDSKAQGNWGEVVLERVLEESGLHKGREYEAQASFTESDGRRLQPDVIVHLPDQKDIVIDAKVSLVAYERYCSAEDEDERKQHLQEHIRSIRQHIDGLSVKNYEHIDGIHTLDFVLVFIPIESAFMAAFECEPALFRTAYDKSIIVVSPTTLLATLRTVQSIWRYEHQNRNAEIIAREAGGLHDQFARVLESLEDLGRHLDRSREAFDKTVDRFSRGRGNMVRRVERLEQLGAKVKKTIPRKFSQASEDFEALPDGEDKE